MTSRSPISCHRPRSSLFGEFEDSTAGRDESCSCSATGTPRGLTVRGVIALYQYGQRGDGPGNGRSFGREAVIDVDAGLPELVLSTSELCVGEDAGSPREDTSVVSAGCKQAVPAAHGFHSRSR